MYNRWLTKKKKKYKPWISKRLGWCALNVLLHRLLAVIPYIISITCNNDNALVTDVTGICTTKCLYDYIITKLTSRDPVTSERAANGYIIIV